MIETVAIIDLLIDWIIFILTIFYDSNIIFIDSIIAIAKGNESIKNV